MRSLPKVFVFTVTGHLRPRVLQLHVQLAQPTTSRHIIRLTTIVPDSDNMQLSNRQFHCGLATEKRIHRLQKIHIWIC